MKKLYFSYLFCYVVCSLVDVAGSIYCSNIGLVSDIFAVLYLCR